MQETELQLILNKITSAQVGTMTMNAGELYLAPDNAVYSVNNISPDANGNVTLSIPAEVTETTVSGWGFTKNTGTVTSVNNVSPVNGNVTISIPSEVTETTVSGWGFTKNVGTVTSVNNVSPVSGNVTLSIPSDTGDLTNNAGFITTSALSGYATETWVGNQGYITGITSSDVTTALGYTPYSSANPNGYTSNIGTVTSVNNVSPVNGNVTLSIPTVNNATLTIQKNSTTVKTFTANASSDVTCNITVPTKISDLTDDTATYPINKADTLTGLTSTVSELNILDGVTATASEINVLDGITATTTELNYVDGVTSAIQTQLNGKQETLSSGTNIKTINSTSLLGNGNIDTTEIFVATYGTTTYAEVGFYSANNKIIYCYYNGYRYTCVGEFVNVFLFSYIDSYSLGGASINPIVRMLYLSSQGWSNSEQHIATNTLSNVSSIDSGSAVATSLNAKADTTLSNVSSIDSNSAVQTALDGKLNTSASNLTVTGQKVFDGQWVAVAAVELLKNATAPTSDLPAISIASSLPNDSYKYEVLLVGAVTTGSTSGNQTRILLQSSIITENIYPVSAQTRAGSTVTAYGNCILPVGSDRNVYVKGYSSNTGSVSIYLMGYRRIGTNI